MNPPLQVPPTILAVAQIIIALGVVASIVEPWVVKWPAVYAVVSRIAGLGMDLRKVVGGGEKSASMTADSKRPPSMPPGAMAMLMCWLVILFVFVVSACSAQQVRTVTPVALEVEQIACVLTQIELGPKEPAELAKVCSIPPDQIQSIVNLLDAQKKAKAEAAKLGAKECK